MRTEGRHPRGGIVDEIRIYYEALEQGTHYILPAVEEALEGVTPRPKVRLIKLKSVSRGTTAEIARTVLPSLRMKDPDGLITVLLGGRELPLAFVEFSTAVQTEDHDQQRFDAFVAAGLGGIPFVKVYAKRSSGFSHGGRVDFDRRATFRLMQQTFETPALEIDWTTDDDNRRALAHSEYPSCPPNHEKLAPLLSALLEYRIEIPTGLLGPMILRDPSRLPLWAQEQVRSNRDAVPPPRVSSRSTRLSKDKDGWTLKFNRWGHAMDPERGMSWYLRSLLRAPLRGVIHDRELTVGDSDGALARLARATGLQPVDVRRKGTEFDLSEAVAQSQLNRVGLAIFGNCHSFLVADGDGIPIANFYWDVHLVEGTGGVGEPATTLRPSSLSSSDVSEDEVTYAIAHCAFRESGYSLIAASYPGAQGDFAVLGATAGRRRRRTYPDIVALLPGKRLVIVESKARPGAPVAEDAVRVRELLENPSWEAELRDQVRSTVPGRTLSDEPILLGVGWWKGSREDEIRVPPAADFAVGLGPELWEVAGMAPEEIPKVGKLSLPKIFLY